MQKVNASLRRIQLLAKHLLVVVISQLLSAVTFGYLKGARSGRLLLTRSLAIIAPLSTVAN